MQKLIVFAAFCFVAVVALPFNVVEDEEGHEYYLLPLNRQRRQTTLDIGGSSGAGTRVTVGHQGTIANNGVHRLDGGAFASKQFRPSGPTTVGGNLGYSHIPSGSNLNLNAQHTRGFGTDVGATGTANIWRNGNSRLDAVGSYQRHFGGVGGTGRPNAYGGLNFNHRF